MSKCNIACTTQEFTINAFAYPPSSSAARSSTRVHAPPGGSSSISFGSSSPVRIRKSDTNVQMKVEEKIIQNPKPAPVAVQILKPAPAPVPVAPAQFRRASAQAMMRGSNIFGDENAAPGASLRGVRQAPGEGQKSSFSLA